MASDKKKIQREVDVFKHWTLRILLKISWTKKKTNEEVRSRMNMAGLTLRVQIKDRRFRYVRNILRGSAGKELKDITETEITL